MLTASASAPPRTREGRGFRGVSDTTTTTSERPWVCEKCGAGGTKGLAPLSECGCTSPAEIAASLPPGAQRKLPGMVRRFDAGERATVGFDPVRETRGVYCDGRMRDVMLRAGVVALIDGEETWVVEPTDLGRAAAKELER